MKKSIFIYFSILLVLGGCKNNNTMETKLQEVRVCNVYQSNASDKREFPFISKAYQSSELSFRVGGPLNNFDIQAGDYFTKGDVIASIDQRDFLLNKKAKESEFIRAKAEFERVKSLYEKQNVSAKIFDNAKTNYCLSKTAYEVAENAVEDTRLIAPFNGYVQDIRVEAHQVVKAHQNIISFINIEKLKLESYIPENISYNSKDILSINVCFDALKGVDFTASSWDISKSTTSNNISFLLTTIVDNNKSSYDLLAGMTGSISFTQQRNKESTSLLIPQIAVCQRPSLGAYVWIYNPKTKKVQMTPVSLGGLQKNAYVEITKGLNENDLVVTTGLNYLSNNMSVIVTNK